MFTCDNFCFSARAIIGYFLQPAPPPYATDGEYIRMTDSDVAKRLEELKMFTKQSLNVEQRIEIARQQQALRDAKKMAKEEIARNKEKVNLKRKICLLSLVFFFRILVEIFVLFLVFYGFILFFYWFRVLITFRHLFFIILLLFFYF